MNRTKTMILGLVLVCQIGVLAGVYLNSIYPHYLGQAVTLKIVPVDPRSLFRGQYARLAYDIGTIKASKLRLEHPSRLRTGEIVYVTLVERDGLHKVEHIQLDTPKEGLFIRGRVNQRQSTDEAIQITYGIEAYFAAPEKALAVQRSARSRNSLTLARVMIAPNGKAALVDIVSK